MDEAPVPVTAIAAVPLVDEVLTMVSTPAAAPRAVGSNSTPSVAVWPGDRVSGNVGPDSVKPTPARTAELTVTGAVPIEDKIKVCVAGVFKATFPNPMLVALMLSVGTVTFNWRANVLETFPALASRVTACAVVTEDTVAVNVALVAPASTVSVAGTVTALLPLDKLTASPPLPAAALSVTVQASVPGPVMDALVQENALTDALAGAEAPAPFRATTTVPSVEEVLVAVICPAAGPVASGLNCTFRS